MGNKRTRKLPLTSTKPAASTSAPKVQAKTHKATQATISTYHTLIKRRAQLVRQAENGASSSRHGEEIKKIDAEIEALGGLESYQTASIYGQSAQRGGDSAKVLIGWLRELGYHKQSNRQLEIGALTPDNYASCSTWIENHPIDLHSQHPLITEQDFFDRPLPEDDSERFDVISCSLVLNFVADIRERGRMLQLMHQHLRPDSTSLLYLVLPLPCVRNSRYLSPETMKALFSAVGFEQIRERWKPNGKVGYWLFSWKQPGPAQEAKRWTSKKIVEDGPGKNNFAIVLP